MCGNTVVEFGEDCDLGLDNADGSLSSYCQSGLDCDETECNDTTNERTQEQINQCIFEKQQARACRSTCVFAGCGDAVRDQKERCDDGNQVDNDSCDNNCRIVTHCIVSYCNALYRIVS